LNGSKSESRARKESSRHLGRLLWLLS